MGLDEYDRDRIHHSVLTADEVHDWYERWPARSGEARLDRAGMVVGREDVIVGGALILSVGDGEVRHSTGAWCPRPTSWTGWWPGCWSGNAAPVR